MFTDSHTHLNHPDFAHDLTAVIQRAQAARITRFIVPATQAADWPRTAALAAAHIVPAFGIHPWFATTAQNAHFPLLADYLNRYPQAAIGEIGLDYRLTADPYARHIQTTVLQQQLQLARDLNRFIILHNAKSTAALLHILKPYAPLKGIVHAFSGSLEEAHQFIRLGLLIGIGSLLLKPNAKKARTAAQTLPLTAIVLETDSPFMLGPQRNEPANTAAIAQTVCRLRDISPATLSATTEHNIHRLITHPTTDKT